MTSTGFGSARLVLASILAGALLVGSSAQEGRADELRQCREDLDACRIIQASTFLIVMIQWPTAYHDVDLHVVDAAGSEFFYEAKTVPGGPGELVFDMVQGPGVEVWEVSKAPSGEYRVLYNFFDRHGNSEAANVTGTVFHRGGRYRLRTRSLSQLGRANALLAAVVTVGDDGSVEVYER